LRGPKGDVAHFLRAAAYAAAGRNPDDTDRAHI
jgi:hypothetical protein